MTCRCGLGTCPPASAHGDTKRRLRCADTHTHSRLGDIGQFAALAPLHRVSPRPLSEFGYIIYHHLLTSSPQQTQTQGRVTTLQSYRREVHEWWLQPTPTADEERRTTNDERPIPIRTRDRQPASSTRELELPNPSIGCPRRENPSECCAPPCSAPGLWHGPHRSAHCLLDRLQSLGISVASPSAPLAKKE
jgi:hypothetical protein